MVSDDDLVFKALADPTRRQLLDRLFARDGQTLTELESQVAMTRFGVMKHLRVLEDALPDGTFILGVVYNQQAYDGTFDALSSLLVDHASDDILLKVDHGGPKFGSIDHPQRWAQLALCCNAVMDAFPDAELESFSTRGN